MKVPKVAELEAVNVTVCGAVAVTLKGDLGDAVSPAGRPEMTIETLAENPFKGATETCTFTELPAVTVSDCEEVWMLKSGAGGGGGGVLLPPPPQPTKPKTKKKRNPKRAMDKELYMYAR